MPRNKLTPKQEKFVKAYVETGNGTQSALQTYSTTSANTAAVMAYENLRKPHIANAIEREKTQMAEYLRPERIVSNVERISRKSEEEGQYSQALKGQELLGRAAGLWDGDKDQAGRITVNIVMD